MTTLLEPPETDGMVHALLVEDSDGDARLVELMLEGSFGRDIDLVRARSIAEALSLIGVRPPDCVILDLGLPDAHGLEAVRMIKACAPLLPIVVLTGEVDGGMGTQAVAAGAQDYLVKGNTVDETLTRSIRYAVVRKTAEDALVRGRQALAEAQRVARLGSWELDLRTGVMTWSDELCRLYGFEPDPVPTFDDFLERFHPEDRDGLVGLFRSALRAHSPWKLDHRVVLPDGTARWVRSQGLVEHAPTGAAVWMYGTAQDITEQKTAEGALEHQALHDPLTDLPNRALLHDRIGQALARIGRNPASVALLFIDVDRFKVINDSLGHVAGDQVLVALAERLQSVLRPGDTLARFGGDEFAVLCEHLHGEVDAVGMADRLSGSLTLPLTWHGGELVVTVSIGIVLASSALVSPESLLRDADAAMYRAKEGGRARSAVFADGMRARSIGRLDTEVSLRQALEHGELEAHYQPIFEIPLQTLAGFEALVRWRHPTRGLLGPDEFIPIAEETGLIIPLGTWMLRTAAAQAALWQQRPGCTDLRMAVNLSGAQVMHPELVATMVSVLAGTGLPPRNLQLEITESIIMQDAARAAETLTALTELGLGVSIDDFGTGYSSLSRLRSLPVNVIKIDRSFVEGLGQDAEDSAIARAILSLATALGLTAVAEGVETVRQRDYLVELGCRFAQGYLLGRPAAPEEMEHLIDRHGGLLPARRPS